MEESDCELVTCNRSRRCGGERQQASSRGPPRAHRKSGEASFLPAVVAMSRKLYLALLFGGLLVCATLTRAEEDVEVEDDDEDDEEEEDRAALIVRRTSDEAPACLAARQRLAGQPAADLLGPSTPAGCQPPQSCRLPSPALPLPPLAPSQWPTSVRWRASRPP